MKIWIQLSILVLAVCFTNQSFAGSEAGNGGGVICVRGFCETLIEAGLRLSPDYNGKWIPERQDYQGIHDLIHFNTALSESAVNAVYFSVFGRGDRFRRVEIIDQLKAAAIRRRYAELAKATGLDLDPATFRIVAFSSDNTTSEPMTYLLPEFFKLEPARRAQILLHEGLYRGQPIDRLRNVLQFESSIAEIKAHSLWCGHLTRAEDSGPCVDQILAGYRLGYIAKNSLFGELIRTIFSTYKLPASTFGKFMVGLPSSWDFDASTIAPLGRFEPRLPVIVSKIFSVRFTHVNSYYSATGDQEPMVKVALIPSKSPLTIDVCEYTHSTDQQKAYYCHVYEPTDLMNLPLELPQ